MILPDPVRFLMACEYEEVYLGHALGDELFLALHLIIKGCKDYMSHLKKYHLLEQNNALHFLNLFFLSELKMHKLKDYNTVPSPEQIHFIVADCVTAAYDHLCYVIDMVGEETGNTVLDSGAKRDNTYVLKRIRKLRRLFCGTRDHSASEKRARSSRLTVK
jgi:hypothetical protein